MATKTTVIFTDDLDDTDGPGVATRQFMLDGVSYEIDLSEANYAELVGTLTPYLSAARRQRSPRQAAKRAPRHQERPGMARGTGRVKH